MADLLRIATFNLENLDDKPGEEPALDKRIALMRPQLLRLNADILCLQEVNGQEQPGQPRRLLALDRLLAGTGYAEYQRASTSTTEGQVFDERNLVILSRFAIAERAQHRHRFAPAPRYRQVTAEPAQQEAEAVSWERPILHARVRLDDGRTLEVINLHLKSRLPATVAGQKVDQHTWRTASGWAEGYFLSSIQRVGQALEARILVDSLFDENPDALIAVCGDFNAEADEVALEAICGELENTNNPRLAGRVLVPCERTVPLSSRYSLLHRGQGRMLDHVLVSRALLAGYRGSEIHNELLHDESLAFATDKLYPESDHAPVVATFELPAG